MNKKQSKILRITFGVISILMMSLSIFTITIYKQALNPDLYKQAFAQSDIYEITVDIFERKISESLISWEKQLVASLVPDGIQDKKIASLALNFVTGTIIEQQTPAVVSDIFDKIDVKSVLQNIIEKQIDNDISWLKGERETREIFNYIPTPEQIQSIDSSNLIGLVDSLTKNALGINNLPQCRTQHEVNENIKMIMSNNAQAVTCTSSQIDVLLEEAYSQSKLKNINTRVSTNISQSKYGSEIENFLEDIYNVSYALANLKQAAINIQANIQYVKTWSLFLLFLSFILGGISVYLHEKGKRLRAGVLLILINGVAILLLATLYSVIAYFSFGNIMFSEMAIGTNFLTSTESTLLTNSVQYIVEHIIYGLVDLSWVVGFWIVILSGLTFGIIKVYDHRQYFKTKFDFLINKNR
jgi:hypothetical protein